MIKFIFIVLVTCLNIFALDVGKVPPHVVISGSDGGKVGGGVWDSSMLKGKVFVLFYVDPDEKDLNDKFANVLKNENLNHEKYSSIAIVNMAATWKPNFIIEALLKHKQKKFPQAIYVKDKQKVLVREWGLKDNSYDVLIFDKKGKVIYQKNGKIDDSEIDKIIKLIKSNM